MFGMLNIYTVVRVPQPMSNMGWRIKRVNIANIHCAYVERESVFEAFKLDNQRLPASELMAEFKYSEHL